MKKVIFVILVIAAAVWYFDIGRKMTETSIRENYQSQREALNRFDAEPLCDAMDDEYRAAVTVRGSADGSKTMNKARACAELTRTLRRFKQLSERTGGMIEPDFEIKSIELSANRKSATVELTNAMRLGDMTLSRGHSVDHLIRRNGRILSASSEDTVRVYQGE